MTREPTDTYIRRDVTTAGPLDQTNFPLPQPEGMPPLIKNASPNAHDE